MAVIKQPETNGFDISELAPQGTFVATCLGVQDQFGVERPKFENPTEKETLDVTRFLFGFRGQDGRTYRVQTHEFRISGSPKSNLLKFLTAWLGHPPKYGWDYCELKGAGAIVTVGHKPSRDGTRTFANIVGISPVLDQLRSQVLPLAAFGQPSGQPQAAPAPLPPQAPTAAPVQPAPAYPAAAYATPAPQPAPAQAPQAAWNPEVDSDDNCPF
jgi:hypothetical protein